MHETGNTGFLIQMWSRFNQDFIGRRSFDLGIATPFLFSISNAAAISWWVIFCPGLSWMFFLNPSSTTGFQKGILKEVCYKHSGLISIKKVEIVSIWDLLSLTSNQKRGLAICYARLDRLSSPVDCAIFAPNWTHYDASLVHTTTTRRNFLYTCTMNPRTQK